MNPADARTVPVEGIRPDLAALLGERESLDAVFGGQLDGVTVHAADGSVVYANAAALRAMGIASLDETPHPVDEKGEPVPLAEMPARKVLDGAPASEVLVGFRAAADRATRWALAKASPVRDATGRVTHAVSFLRDVTAERQAQERQRFLAEASGLLSESLDPNATLATLARLAVPLLGDWCEVDLVAHDGRIEQLAVAHVDPAQVRLGQEIARRYPVDPASGRAVARVLRTRESILVPEISDDALRSAAVDAAHLELLRQAETRSAIVVPLGARGRVFGAITLCISGENPRRYTEEDLRFVEDLAARAATAVDNARLFQESEATRARLDEIVNGVEGILWEAEAGTRRFTFVSHRAVDMLGYPLERWMAEPGFWASRLHPQDREATLAHEAERTRAGEDHELEYRILDSEGNPVWLRDTVFILPGEEGHPARARGLMVDITARKHAEGRHKAQSAVALLLAKAPSLDAVISDVLEAIGTNLGWEIGALWRKAPGEDRLRWAAGWNAPSVKGEAFFAESRAHAFARTEGIPGGVWAGGRALWISDFSNEPRLPRASIGREAGLHSAIGIPIWSGEELFGVLEFFTRDHRAADASLIAVVEGLGAQVGQYVERHEAVAAVKESNARRGAVLETALDCIVSIDHNGTILEWNASAERTFGYAREEAIGREMARLIVPPEYREMHRRGMAHYNRTGEGPVLGRRIEITAMRKDGSVFPVELAILPTKRENGPPIFVGHIRDITERKRAEAELESIKHNLEMILNSVSEGVYGVDAEGNTTFMNAAALKMTGLTPEEAIGRKLHGVIHHSRPDGSPYPAPECPIYKAAHGGPRASCTDEVFFTKDGEPFSVEYVTSPIHEGDAVVGAVTVFKDVTERRQTEDALRDSSERTRSILESISDAFFALDHEWRFTYVNRQAEILLGRKQEELLGKCIWVEYADALGTPFEENYRKAVATQAPAQFEAWFDPLHNWYDVRAYPSPEGLSVYFQTITERKRAEIEIREGRERLDIAVGAAELGTWDLDLQRDSAVRSLRHDQIFGYDTLQAEWGAERFMGHVLPEHRAQVQAAFERAFEEGRLTFECEILRADGKPAWITAQGRVLYEGGRPVRMLGVVADITERRRTEEALQQERHLLTAILQQLPAGVVIAEMPSGRLVLANDQVNRILEHEFVMAEGMEQYSQYPIFRPDGTPIPAEETPMARALMTGESVGSMELLYRVASGAYKTLLVNAAPVRDARGAVVAGVAAFIDITPLKQAENALRRNASLLAWQRRVLESIATGEPLAGTLDTLCREAEAQSPGRHFTVLLVDEDGRRLRHGAAPGLPDHYNRAVDGIAIGEGVGSCGTAAHRGESVVVTDIETDPLWKDFKALALSVGLRACWSTPILGSDGRLLGTWAVYRTTPGDPAPEEGAMVAVATRLAAVAIERSRAERELRHQRDLTKTITDNAASALFMMDASGYPIFMNPAAVAMTGYASIEEIKAKPLHYAVHFRRPDGSHYPMEECPIDRANAEIKPLKDQREVFCRKDGSLFPVEFNVAPIERGGEKLGAVLEVRDITDSLRAEEESKSRAEELMRLADALQRSNRELDQFAYVTSHDLKAPLRGIANLSRWIEEDLGEKLTDDSREHLDLLRGRVHRMESLIDAILEYSRVGRVRGRAETVNTRALVEEVVDLISPPEGFQVHVEGPMPTLVTERMRLQQVFMNLLGNAIKHHHAKERGHITVAAEDLGSEYRFSVTDDGPGISPRFHEKIFVIFQTLEPRDKVEGTGIGLALVKKIVESQGGSVSVESAEGEGATFRFTWPKSS